MERVKKYKKEIIGVTLMLSILMGTILLINPSQLGSEKTAYSDIQNKQSALIDANNQSVQLVSKNKELQEDLESIKQETFRVKSIAKTKRAEINDDDLKYHLPSILIRLENNAIRNNLKLDIDHSGIREYKDNAIDATNEDLETVKENQGLTEEVKDIEDSTEISNEDLNEAEEVKEESEKDKNDKAEQKKENKDTDERNANIDSSIVPMIYGFNTTIIPLTVEGQFKEVRSFINYLDKINYLENTSIALSSDGEKVVGKILLSVFHGSL